MNDKITASLQTLQTEKKGNFEKLGNRYYRNYSELTISSSMGIRGNQTSFHLNDADLIVLSCGFAATKGKLSWADSNGGV